MPGPLPLKTITIDPAALLALPPERRGALLLTGHLLNEANWLRKLLVQSVYGIAEGPEGQAQFGLTVILATTLASKLYEGWQRINAPPISPEARGLPLPPELIAHRKRLHPRFNGNSLIEKIRNGFGFHYPKTLDLTRLPAPDAADTTLIISEQGYRGDMFSHVAALAAIDALIAHHPDPDWHVSLKAIWEEITEVAGAYCAYISELLAHMLSEWLAGQFSVSDGSIAAAGDLDKTHLVFFVHPPADFSALVAETEDRRRPAAT